MALGRRKVYSRKTPGQIPLLPEMKRKTPQEFATGLLKKNLITKTSKRKNVLKEVADAYSRIVRLQGIDFKALVKAMGESELSAEKILHNKGVIKPVTRSPAEQARIRQAVETIVRCVNRKRRWDDVRKQHAQTRPELVEKSVQQRHLKSISRETTPAISRPERPARTPSLFGRIIGFLLRPFTRYRRKG